MHKLFELELLDSGYPVYIIRIWFGFPVKETGSPVEETGVQGIITPTSHKVGFTSIFGESSIQITNEPLEIFTNGIAV